MCDKNCCKKVVITERGERGPQGLQGVQGIPGTNGTNGIDGKSAYEIWIDEGNTGTEQDFLDSLKNNIFTSITESTNSTILYDAETNSGDVGLYRISVIGKRGNDACFTGPTTVTLNTLASPQIANPTVANTSSASIPFLNGSVILGTVNIFSDSANNTFKIIVIPDSATSTIWKVKVDFVKI